MIVERVGQLDYRLRGVEGDCGARWGIGGDGLFSGFSTTFVLRATSAPTKLVGNHAF